MMADLVLDHWIEKVLDLDVVVGPFVVPAAQT